MTQIAVLVEGQTEERFVNEVLQPTLNPSMVAEGPWLKPIVVQTSRTPAGVKRKGGGTTWAHYGRDLSRLLRGSHWHRVALLMDLYAYPSDAPGADIAAPDCGSRQAGIIGALREHYGDPRFEPGIVLHEFETLVIASAVGRETLLGEHDAARCLQAVAATFSNDVELIDEGPRTAPSKRVRACWPDYDKVIDGVSAVAEAGIGHVRALCPAFDDWLRRLTA